MFSNMQIPTIILHIDYKLFDPKRKKEEEDYISQKYFSSSSLVSHEAQINVYKHTEIEL